jgi:NADPH:quinone reductase
MRAIVVKELSGPDAAALDSIPLPEGAHRLTDGERMLVEVHAAGIAFTDVLSSRGLLQLPLPPPYVPGAEASGIVVEAPAGSGFAPGDRVSGSILGGALAEFALMRPEFTITLPDSMSFAIGAALPLNYTTAWLALERAAFREGDTVLVMGAAGGVGTAALDLIRGFGGRSIAVVSTDEKERVARIAGADEVVRSTGAWVPEVRELTDGRGVEIVLDTVGGDNFLDHLAAMALGGRLLVIGFAGGSIPAPRLNRLLLRNLSVIGYSFDVWEQAIPGTARRVGDEVRRLAEDGRITPYIGTRLPLEEGAEALRILDERRALGKVVVDVREPQADA